MTVLRVDVTKPFLPPLEEYTEHLKDIWDARWLTNNGPKLQALEAALEKAFGVNNLVLCNNGTSAITLALMSLKQEMREAGCEDRNEVITTPFTFAATASAIIEAGFTPVFADVESTSLTLCPNSIESMISERTAVILPVHVYGISVNHEKYTDIAKRHGLTLIYDAAHSVASVDNGESLLAQGDMACFSLHATKLFHTVEGGGIVVKTAEQKAQLKQLMNFGLDASGDIAESGMNAKMSEFHAAMGLTCLPYLVNIIEARQQVYAQYEQGLSGVADVSMLSQLFPSSHNYSYCPIKCHGGNDHVDAIMRALNEKHIFPRRYFRPSLTLSKAYHQIRGTAPQAETLSHQMLCLPIYPDLALDVVDLITSTIRTVGR
ncbi:DegT/DnrJ/EryC1/StrS family aminotransferase [Aestuariibacter sp. AA17]|uniref:DegT/DnrJ/EryC1/StrS family aminotransferase n=1 Tax=Fluctibacter corallii TaxID=2984329 RepID=A0ABT3A3M0_9ALTE|nr:DegT/DnrJ/EryC1/StrS family aminotransferase [Aestuariibacter sp. AA17]MCV2883281.1 DegT/DnrJ/EryC1/StrS family aminotransferase [Aestuariibacter sp. AA17]